MSAIGDAPFGKIDLHDFTEVFRIDLNRKRWCYRECTTSKQIYSLTDEMLTLEKEDKASSGLPVTANKTINRQDGSYSSTSFNNYFGLVFLGKCALAPFTGMQEKLF